MHAIHSNVEKTEVVSNRGKYLIIIQLGRSWPPLAYSYYYLEYKQMFH